MRILITTALALTLAAGVAFTQDKGKGGAPKAAPVPGMALTSPDFQDGAVIPDKFTQAAPNAPSPVLNWTQVPAGTQAYTLLLHDPDPSINKTTEDVLHWMIFNIPGTATGLPGGIAAGNLADGSIQVKNRGGNNAYMGPGNPAINPYHHYTFELYALDAKLALDATADRAAVMKAMDGHILGKAVLVGRFKRPQ